jgi:prefoldin alpha subunit
MSEDPQKILQGLYMEAQLTEQNLSILQQRLEFSQVLLNSYRTGLMVLQELENKGEGEEMLMNVGGSIYVRANLVDPNQITRTLGSGVRIEQSLEEAKKGVEEAVSALENQYKQLSEEHGKLVAHSSKLNAEMNRLVALIQGQGTGE